MLARLAPAGLGAGSGAQVVGGVGSDQPTNLGPMPVRAAPAIRDLLADGRQSFSFEFMPPKTEAEEERLWLSIRQLEPLRPTFVSVTYGAGGSTRDRTVRVTGRIAEETTLTPMGHLTAVNHSVAELRHVIGSYAAVGVRNVLALRGDPPGDPGAEWSRPPGRAELRRGAGPAGRGRRATSASAWPRSPRGTSGRRARRRTSTSSSRKCRAGRRLRDHPDVLLSRGLPAAAGRGRRRGCDVPIIPGIMPIISVPGIERAVMLSGCRFPESPGRRPAAARR